MSWEDPTAPRTPWAQRLGHCGPTVATNLRSVGKLRYCGGSRIGSFRTARQAAFVRAAFGFDFVRLVVMLSTFSTTLAKAAADVSERVAGEIEEFKNEAARLSLIHI